MSKDTLVTLRPHKLDIKIIDIKVRDHNRSNKNEISKSEIEKAYKLNKDYFIVEEIDFSNSSIPIENFTNVSKMNKELIKGTENIIGRLKIFKETDDMTVEESTKKRKSIVRNNIYFILDKIFHKDDISISNINTKYSLSSFKWDGNIKEELNENTYKVNVEVVITSLTGIGAFDGARKFCESNKRALKTAVRKYLGYDKPIVKIDEKDDKTTTTKFSITSTPKKGGLRKKYKKVTRVRKAGYSKKRRTIKNRSKNQKYK